MPVSSNVPMSPIAAAATAMLTVPIAVFGGPAALTADAVLPSTLAFATSDHEQPRAADQPRSPLALHAHETAPPAGYKTLVNSGSSAMAVSVVTDDGGGLFDGKPRVASGEDKAIRYPRYSDAADAPHAVVQVVDRRGPDDLNPKSRQFRFGADFILDAKSEDSAPGGRDNGDNLVQRGRFDQRAQYKVQVDHRVATCRVKGLRGVVTVSSRTNIAPRTWYRVRCVRDGSVLRIVVTTWAGGSPVSVTDSASGPTGDLTPSRRTVPLSVGGKLDRPGLIADASDQFNGRIDNVVIRVG
jgi:hypothetical protein